MEWVPVLQWSIVLALLTALGAPIAAAVFRPLPRRGGAFSLPVALVVLAVVTFWLGQVTYGRHTVVAGVLVVAACAGVALYYGAEPDWRAVAAGGGVFLLGFAFYLLYSAFNAAITPAGGEQFLHYGLSNALTDAGALPPEDFWWAGEPIRYYYGTQLQVASLSLLSGVELRYGYFLALSTFYGVLFVTAYGLVGSVLAARDRSYTARRDSVQCQDSPSAVSWPEQRDSGRHGSTESRLAVYHLGGAFGALFVALAGSLTAFLRLAYEFFPAGVREWSSDALFGALVADRGNTFQEAVNTQGTASEWFWWNARYVIEGGLYEFPLYSFVKADLHGHGLSTGYVLLSAAVALSYYHTPASEHWRRRGLLFGGLGLVAGLFGFMNTWSLPTAVGLAWLAMAAAGSHPATLLPGGTRLVIGSGDAANRLADEAWRLVLAAMLAVPVGLIGVLVASPFLLGGVPTNEGVGLFPPQSDLGPFLAVYGGLLVLFVALLLSRSVGAGVPERRRNRLALAAAVLALVVVPLAVDNPAVPAVLAAVGPLLLVAWWLVRTDRLGFEAVLLVGGLGLLLALELVHAKVWPPDRIRWNTTLKVAVQGWTLAGAAGGAAAALLVSDAAERLREPGAAREGSPVVGSARSRLERLAPRIRTAGPAVLALVLVSGVVLASLPFAALAVNGNVGGELDRYLHVNSEGSIDGLGPHDRWKGDQMAAIYWLDEQGQPTIVEAPSRSNYRWQNAASVFSGAVTVAGWNHQAGYRGEAAYDRRASAVENVYVGPWANATRTLRAHDVEYIYVGQGERDRFEDRIRKFGSYEGISVAFENGAVTIYAVDGSALDPDERA